MCHPSLSPSSPPTHLLLLPPLQVVVQVNQELRAGQVFSCVVHKDNRSKIFRLGACCDLINAYKVRVCVCVVLGGRNVVCLACCGMLGFAPRNAVQHSTGLSRAGQGRAAPCEQLIPLATFPFIFVHAWGLTGREKSCLPPPPPQYDEVYVDSWKKEDEHTLRMCLKTNVPTGQARTEPPGLAAALAEVRLSGCKGGEARTEPPGLAAALAEARLSGWKGGRTDMDPMARTPTPKSQTL